MPYQVSRTDTGQFVVMDAATDTVVIDDDLGQGFAKLEAAIANKPAIIAAPPAAHGGSPGSDTATQGSSTFAFRGGPRYSPTLLAIVLPFAWLAVLYFALANLLSETALDRGATEQTEARVDELEREIQTLRSEIAGAPRTAKTQPSRPKSEPKPSKPAKPEVVAEVAGDSADDDEDDDEPKAEVPPPSASGSTSRPR